MDVWSHALTDNLDRDTIVEHKRSPCMTHYICNVNKVKKKTGKKKKRWQKTHPWEGESIFCHLADTMHTTCRMPDLISINDYMSKCLYTSWSIRHDATLCFERERRMGLLVVEQ